MELDPAGAAAAQGVVVASARWQLRWRRTKPELRFELTRRFRSVGIDFMFQSGESQLRKGQEPIGCFWGRLCV